MIYIDNTRHIALWLTMMEANTDWHSVDAHFEDGAGSVSLSLLPIKAVNNQFMTMCNLSPPRLHMIHDQQSLTFRWRLFSWWGMESIVICFAYNGSQNSFMTQLTLSEVSFPRMHDQKQLTLHWRSFSWWAWRVLQSVMPIKAPKDSSMTHYTLSEVSFPKTHDQK